MTDTDIKVKELMLLELSQKQTVTNKFITDKSNDITSDMIFNANNILNRKNVIINIDNILHDLQKSMLLELGIFEYSLVYMLNENLNTSLLTSIYNDVSDNIVDYLHPNSYIKSKSLKDDILNNIINAQYIAFLSPEQISPERWSDIITKKKYEEAKDSNVVASDTYKCYKCKEKKCRISQLQTRCADEPMTTFITCLVCHSTWKQ